MDTVIAYKIKKYIAKIANLGVEEVEKKDLYNKKLNYYYQMIGGLSNPGRVNLNNPLVTPGIPQSFNSNPQSQTLKPFVPSKSIPIGCDTTKSGPFESFLTNYFNDKLKIDQQTLSQLNNVFNGNYGTKDTTKQFTWGIYKKTLMHNPLSTGMLTTDINIHGDNVNKFFYPPLKNIYNEYQTKHNKSQFNFNDITSMKECFRAINKQKLYLSKETPKINGKDIDDNTLMTKDIFQQLFQQTSIKSLPGNAPNLQKRIDSLFPQQVKQTQQVQQRI